MTKEPLICWALTDGRRGMENQALGLAEAVAAEGGLQVNVKRVTLTETRGFLPESVLASPFVNPLAHMAQGSDPLVSPWPDLLIGCGRQAAGLSVAIRRAAEGAGHKTVTVQCQDPRMSPEHFDLVVPPLHDRLKGANVIPILGAPHRVTASKLAEEAALWRPSVASLPRPLVAVLIGGRSSAYDMGVGEAKKLTEQLLALKAETGCGLAITASRRTGKLNLEFLRANLRGTGIWFWDDAGDNPYFGLLALADHIVVTSDSTNMVTEACATGKPVHVVHLPGGNKKFRRFHRAMEARGLARPFTGELNVWAYEPLNEAARIAPRIRALLGLDDVTTRELAHTPGSV